MPMHAGMMSEVKEVQSIALTTISRLVQSAGKEQIQPHLVDLTIAMLESLSGMEVRSELQPWNTCHAHVLKFQIISCSGVE